MDMSHTAALVLRTRELTHFVYELDKTAEDSDAIIKSCQMQDFQLYFTDTVFYVSLYAAFHLYSPGMPRGSGSP